MQKFASLVLLSASVFTIQFEQSNNQQANPAVKNRATIGSRRGAGRAGAAQTAAEVLNRLKSFDENADGLVDESELPPLFKRHFKDADTNKDSHLDAEELVKLSATIIKQRSSPGKPTVSPEDIQQVLDFALQFDKDKDGGLNAAELKEYAKATALRRAQNGGRRRGRGQYSGPPSAPKGLGAPGVGTDDPFGSAKPAFGDK